MTTSVPPDAGPTPTQALTWVDPDTLTIPVPTDMQTRERPRAAVADLLVRRPRRSAARPAVLVPTFSVLGLAGAYVAATLLWPLTAVTPTVTHAALPTLTGAPFAPAWPEVGSAAVTIEGFPMAVSPGSKVYPMASITKVVTALVVLDAQPLAPGEQGPAYEFEWADESAYWSYLARDESATEVPRSGETLSEYQMLQAILLASAGNYADKLVLSIWNTEEEFQAAAQAWLSANGLNGIDIVEPTGFDPDNTADAASVARLGQIAMSNPVFAEIVGTQSAELPGVGTIENTNELLADPDVIGIKTGSLYVGQDYYYNLAAAAEVIVDDTRLVISASILAQDTNAERFTGMRALLDSAIADLPTQTTLPAGTLVAEVTTAWGESASVVTTEDASLTLWNGVTAETSASVELEDSRGAGDTVGSVTATGPLGTREVPAVLTSEIEPPSIWWRLTHPLELFGLVG